MIRPQRLIAPVASALDLPEVKLALGISGAGEDVALAAAIKATIAQWDGWGGELNRCLINQTWRHCFATFPSCDVLLLCVPDVQSCVVRYLDELRVEQVLSAALYTIRNTVRGAALVLAPTAAWPRTARAMDAVRVEFVAGFGAAHTDLPDDLRFGMIDAVAVSFFAIGRDPSLRSQNIPGVQTVEFFAASQGATGFPPRAQAARERYRFDPP